MTAVADQPSTVAGTFTLPPLSPGAEPRIVTPDLVRLARELTAGTLGPLPTPDEFFTTRPWSSASPAWVADSSGLYDRMTRPDLGTWMAHAGRAGGCTRPVRLQGGTTTVRVDRTLPGKTGLLSVGHVVDSFDTSTSPDGVVYKPCGTRRASLCPSCAERYRYDTYQVIRAGLAGGKGVPETVTEHPAVFVTLTAPSFGLVHSGPAHEGAKLYRCHPRRDKPRCPHGRPASCTKIHRPGDKQVGRPLCADCYDYDHAAVWNHFVPRLWDRTLTLLRRHLGESVKVRYAKVAEFQRRGAVHLHAVLRLDGHDPADPEAILTPPAWASADWLKDAVQHAASSAAMRTPTHPDRATGWPIAWGDQGRRNFADVRVINRGIAGAEVTEQHVAGYLAKYSTKGAETTGLVSGRLTDETIGYFADHNGSHTARLLAACWDLGRPTPGTSTPLLGRPAPARPVTEFGPRWTCDCGTSTRLTICPACPPPAPSDDVDLDDAQPAAGTSSQYAGLRRWAHMLGFGGHFSTKSRRYSTTLGQLRADRAAHVEAENNPTAVDPATQSDADSDETTLVIRRWSVVGFGWRTPADAALAGLAADAARQRRAADHNSQAV